MASGMKINSIYHRYMEETIYDDTGISNEISDKTVGQILRKSSGTQSTGLQSTGAQCYRRVSVCLGLLCVLLLTALIALTVHCVYGTGVARDVVLKTENDQLWINYSSLVSERDQLQQSYATLARQFCPQGWNSFSSRCYYISTISKSWTDSQQDCKQRGADLVIINSKEEQAFISVFKWAFWIGLSDQEKEGTWKWVDGTTLSEGEGNWNNKQPDDYNGDEDCTESRSIKGNPQKTWNDLPCSRKQAWICEKEGEFLT